MKRLLSLTLIILTLLAGRAVAAVAFDATSASGANGSGGPAYSWTHTPVGTPTAVGVWITIYGGGNTVTGVTYGGVAMTQALHVANGSGPGGSQNDSDYLFGLASPPSGSQTVAVATSGANQYIIAAVVTVTGSNASTCFRSVANTQPAASPASTSVSTVTGDLVVDMVQAFGGSTLTKGVSQTLSWGPLSEASVYAAGSYQVAGGATTTMAWTYTGAANNTDDVAGVFQQGTGGGSSYHGLLMQGIGQ